MVLVVKNLTANAGDLKDVVRSLGQEDPLEEGLASHAPQYSYLEDPMDRGAWRASQGVAKSRTRLKQLSTLAQKKGGCSTRHILYIP